MKKKSTTIKAWCIATFVSLMSVAGYAATITATVSGNWSNANTWSGGAAGGTVSGDNIVIPAGITVTMDMNVQVTGLLSSVDVTGTLTSATNNSLTINSFGSLTGTGNINLQYLEIGTIGGMSFSGSATIKKFVTSATSLSLGAQLGIVDTLYLKAGSLTLGSGANLMMNTNSTFKIEDGSLTVGSGLFTGINSYNALYVGSSKTTGVELSGAGFNNLDVQLSGSGQNLTLGNNTIVKGTLHHHMGSLLLNGKTLTLKGDYMTMNNAMISGSATSNLFINSANTLSSNLMFNSGARSLNNMEINISSGGNVILGTDMAINGNLNAVKGNLSVINTSTLTMNSGSRITRDAGTITLTSAYFDGTSAYNVNYIGGSKMGSFELTGTGLNNVELLMNNTNDSVRLSSNTTIKGSLILDRGALNINGKKLYLQGILMSTTNGSFQGNSSSELYINPTAGLVDTVYFDSSMNRLNVLSINTGNGSNVKIGSDLNVESVVLTNGGITLYNNDLIINSTGSISGYTTSKYIRTEGSGSLVMNVNSSSPFIMYPVGTMTNMAPAYIQRNSGSGMIGVSTHNGIFQLGTYGVNNATTESVVDRTWDVKSVGSGSIDLNIKFEWTTAMEVNGFDRNNAYISHYTSAAWDAPTATSAATVGTGIYQITRSNVTSLSPFAVVDDNSAVGITEKEIASANVYPNPTADVLNISTAVNTNYSVVVYDAIGNIVMTKDITTQDSAKSIDMSTLNSGIYFVRITGENIQSVKRIVKQ